MTGDREVWWMPSPSGEGTLVLNAHPAGTCAGQGCALHSPSPHWASGMPQRWEFDQATKTGLMERLCPHGLWHDDPDDLDFRRARGMPAPWKGVRPRDCDCPCDCEHEPPF